MKYKETRNPNDLFRSFDGSKRKFVDYILEGYPIFRAYSLMLIDVGLGDIELPDDDILAGELMRIVGGI